MLSLPESFGKLSGAQSNALKADDIIFFIIKET